jgi:flagellar biogenesis protein FliO
MELLQPYLQWIYMVGGLLLFLLLMYLLVRMLSRSVRGKKGARLGISEYYEIDKTRRLVLVRRDDTEHLVLIGGGHDMVIESNIDDNNPTDRRQVYYPEPHPAPMAPHIPQAQHQPHQHQAHPGQHMPQMQQPGNTTMRPPPRPAVFGERRPQLRPVEPHEE